MRTVNALCLSLLLCLPAFPRQPAPSPAAIRMQVSRMAAGSKIVIRLHSREKVKATLVAVEEEAIRVTAGSGREVSQRSIRFDEVREVYNQTPRWVWIAAPAAAAAAVGIVYVLAAHPGN